MRKSSKIPTKCLEKTPTGQTVILGGVHINLKVLSQHSNIDHPYLSRILSGKKEPTISTAKRIAHHLGIGLEDLLELIQQRKQALKPQADAQVTESQEISA